MQNQLEGKQIIVVGGLGGAASAMVLLAAEQGASVLIPVVPGRETQGDLLLSRCEEQGVSGRVHSLPAVLDSETEIEAFLDRAVERLPGFNVLIHCLEPVEARSRHTLLETSLDEWNSRLNERLRLPFFIARRAITEFLASGAGGRMVYVTSATDKHSRCDVGFQASETALGGLVRSIAKEYGRRGITANTVSVEVDERSAVPFFSQSPEKRSAGDGFREIAQAALFLASEEASFIDCAIVQVTPGAAGLAL